MTDRLGADDPAFKDAFETLFTSYIESARKKTAVEVVKTNNDANTKLDTAMSAKNPRFLANELMNFGSLSPEMQEIGYDLSRIIRKEFFFIKAVVILGSNYHGGYMVRELLGSTVKSDFDWGVIFDESRFNREQKSDDIPVVMSKVTQSGKVFLKSCGLTSCYQVNPEAWVCRAPLILDSQHAQGILNGVAKDDKYELKRAMLYLHGSFPHFINEDNRKFIFEALATLSQTNHEQWENVVFNLTKQWREISSIKDKHLKFEDMDEKQAHQSNTISNASEFLMSGIMEKILSKTDRSKQ